MAVRKILAREFTWEVSDGGIPTWLPIGGLLSVSPGTSKTDADTTDFDSDGVDEHMVARRGQTISLEMQYLEDPADGSQDPGQARLLALGALVGAASLEQFRVTSPGGTVDTFSASVDIPPSRMTSGGGVDDPTRLQATLKVSGAIVTT